MDALTKIINKIENTELRKVYTGETRYLGHHANEFIRKYKNDLVKIYPNTFHIFIRKFNRFGYYDFHKFLRHSLLFENGFYDYRNLETIKIGNIEHYILVFIDDDFYARGVEEGYITLDDIKNFLESNPKYDRLLSPILTRFAKQEDFENMNKMIQDAKLEDGIRIKIFNNALIRCKNKECVNFFIKQIKENNYYRLKALKEACYVGYDDYSIDIKNNIRIIEDANNFNYQSYLSKGFRENFYFLKRLQVYSKENFDIYFKLALTSGNTSAKRAALYTSYYNNEILIEDYIEELIETDLDYEDLSYISSISEYLMQKDNSIKLFNIIYDLFIKMDKVNYHYNKNDDVFCATDTSKSNLVDILTSLSLAIDEEHYYSLLDNSVGNMDQESLVIFLEKLSDKTKLDKKSILLTFLKSDNYVVTSFINKQNIKLTLDDAIVVSDYLKSKKETVKKNILNRFISSEDKVAISNYLIDSNIDYKVAIGIEMQKIMGISVEKKEEILKVEKPVAFIENALKEKRKRVKIKNISLKVTKKFYEKICKFIDDNKNFEYKPGYYDEMVTIGTYYLPIVNERYYNLKITDFPLGEMLFKEVGNYLSKDELITLVFKLSYYRNIVNNSNLINKNLEKFLDISKEEKEFIQSISKTYYFDVFLKVIYYLIKENVDKKFIIDAIIEVIQEDSNYSLFYENTSYLYVNVSELIKLCKDENTIDGLERWKYLTVLGLKNDRILIPNEVMYHMIKNDIFDYDMLKYILIKAPNRMWNITYSKSEYYVLKPEYVDSKYREYILRIINESLNCEFNRGTNDTPYTKFISSCREYYGVENFVKAIKSIRNLTLVRGSWFSGTEKNVIISGILRKTIKLGNDTYDAFVKLIKEYNITKEELVRASLYNTAFIDYVDEYLKIPNYKLAVYYFVAHLNESLTEEKIEMFKKYSVIDYNDFKDGAFDIAWYEEMIKSVPEKDLKLIYDNAKYLTVAGLHKRAQRFFDARNNRISLDECINKINETRNKDYVLIYSLIPLQSKEDLYNRFIFVQDFLKESKKFGSQRQLSERKVVDIALDNLARLGGYQDTNIFIYEMEATNQIDIYKEISIEEYVIRPKINHLKISLEVYKDNKKISKIPSKYNKYEELVSLKETIKEGEKKLKRVVKSLEDSMCNQIKFDYDKLILINNDYIINDIFSKLILITDSNDVAIIKGKNIVDLNDNCIYPKYVYIAHPIVLKKYNLLDECIDYVIRNNIKQPFKQILREFYSKSELEMTQDDCWRFRGFNVDIKKCIAALKSKGWGISEDVGLRKVYYYQNTISIIFREFDCFYTYDFVDENRELHTISFVDRKTENLIPLKEVDDIVFSECLRDVDLMISISSNSIYDYELAMSTTEMRHAILKSLIQIIGLTNVSFLKDNIKIQGKYGAYLVNIRTGLVFMEGKGNLLVKTIYSNDKPILLDFVDEDPMTADIISKAIYFANDDKIKDPSILIQIKR